MKTQVWVAIIGAVATILAAVVAVSVPYLLAQNVKQENALDTVRAELSGIQSDTYECERVEKKAPGAWEEVETAYVKFQRRYRTAPTVFIAPGQLEVYATQPGMFFRVAARDITTEGFTLAITVAYTSSFTFCLIPWVAIGVVEQPPELDH